MSDNLSQAAVADYHTRQDARDNYMAARHRKEHATVIERLKLEELAAIEMSKKSYAALTEQERDEFRKRA